MKLDNFLVGAATAGAVAFSCGGLAHATDFSFSFSGAGFLGAGKFYATYAPGDYIVDAITGSAADPDYNAGALSTIIGLNDFFGFADNFLYFPYQAYVDGGGIGFSTADGNQYNIASDDSPGYGDFDADYYVFDAANPDASAAAISFTVSPIPEPATWALMLIGVCGLGVALRSTRRQAT